LADDVAINATSIAKVQMRLDKIAQFCKWSGMRIKIFKSFMTDYDFDEQKPTSQVSFMVGSSSSAFLNLSLLRTLVSE